MESVPVLVEGLPEYDQFKVIFPAGREVDFQLLLGPLAPRQPAEPPAAAEPGETNAAAAASSVSGRGQHAKARMPRRLSSKTSLEDK